MGRDAHHVRQSARGQAPSPAHPDGSPRGRGPGGRDLTRHARRPAPPCARFVPARRRRASPAVKSADDPQLVVTSGRWRRRHQPPSTPTAVRLRPPALVSGRPELDRVERQRRRHRVRGVPGRAFLLARPAPRPATWTAPSQRPPYQYQVRARDAAGNFSGLSAAVTLKTPAPSSVLSFTPTHDAYVRADSVGANFGSATTIATDNSPVKHALLTFSPSGIGSRTVVSAKLRLFCRDSSSNGGSVHRVLDPRPGRREASPGRTRRTTPPPR